MIEARFYKKLENNEVHCILCPHYCIIKAGDYGRCGGRRNKGGVLYSVNYGRLTSYGFDPLEKKPLYHFYPGRNIFSLGTFGCNLDCDFCQNWEIVETKSLYMEIGNQDILALAQVEDSIGMAYTYNEPTISYEFVYDMATLARSKGLKNVLVTNGYINQKPLIDLLPLIDAMNIDLKSFDDQFYRSICKGRLQPVLDTIAMASKHTHVEVTSLIIDGENSSLDNIDKLSAKISEIDKTIPLHISRYFPNRRMNLPPTKVETLIEARNVAKNHLDYVYIGNIWGVDNDTLCPRCKAIIVERKNKIAINNYEGGHCTKCNERIPLKF